jgi:putative membrane protein
MFARRNPRREPNGHSRHCLEMNINPLSLPGGSRFALCVLIGAFAPAMSFGQSAVRERVRDDGVTRPAREVRVVESTHPLKRSDREFMEKVARTSMSEVAISRIAATRTSNPEVRRFAQMMIEDHESVIEQLTGLAATRGVSLPAKDPRPEKWEKRDAKNFDREYLDQMIGDHEDAVKVFAKHAKDGEDAETVAYARKFLPKMQQHLQHALDLKRVLTAKRD